MKEPFDAYIQKCLLSGSRSKTILKMNDKSNLSLEDKYEVSFLKIAIVLQPAVTCCKNI